MKEKFFEYNIKEVEKEVLKDCIFILDTNALLDLYRYSNPNRKKFFEILEKIKHDLYLPYQVGEEFFRNKNKVIGEKIKEEETAIKEVDKLLNSIAEKRTYKDNNKLLKDIEKKTEEIKNILKAEEEITEKNILNEDPVLDKILHLYNKKINDSFNEEELSNILKVGEQRYKNKIPPGFEDRSKDKIEKSPYGDFIIWKEIIKIAKEKKRNVLFISRDTKKDWIEEYNSMIISPRKELIREMYKESEKYFWQYKPEKFIKKISQKFNVKNTEELVKQSKNVEEQEGSNVESKLKIDTIIRHLTGSILKNIMSENIKSNETFKNTLKNQLTLNSNLNSKNIDLISFILDYKEKKDSDETKDKKTDGIEELNELIDS